MVRRLLLKLSGEALKGETDGIHDEQELQRVCGELVTAARQVEVAVVVGGGNIVRGAPLAEGATDPTRGHYMGMLATMINGLALRAGIEAAGGRCTVVAPIGYPNVARQYQREEVVADLAAGVIVVFAGGTGHPFFTTDTTAALRAAEIGADAVLKGSNVDGVYSADPRKDPSATRYERLSFDEAIAKRLAVMDLTAFTMCRDHGIDIRVFDMREAGSIEAACGDDPPGTLVAAD
jgi:uridylate kinase